MISLLVIAATLAQPAPITSLSGQYEMIALAVNGDRVAGQYQEELLGGVRRCEFTFSGRIGADRAGTISARWAGLPPKRGRIRLDGKTVVLTIPGFNQIGFCNAPGEVVEADLDKRTSWTDLARVTAPRARFRPAAGAAPSARYVVKGDIVGVLRSAPTTLLVEFNGGKGVTKGWVDRAELKSISE